MARYEFKKDRTPKTKGSLKDFDNFPLGLLGTAAVAPMTVMKFADKRNKINVMLKNGAPKNKRNKRRFK